MKKLAFLLSFLLLSNFTLACDWSKIQKHGDKYLYPKSCHIEFGKTLVQVKELKLANEERKKQAEKLEKTIQLKDLALDTADMRTMRWRDESYNQHEKLLRYQRLSRKSNWLYVAGGFGLAILSVWAAGQLNN